MKDDHAATRRDGLEKITEGLGCRSVVVDPDYYVNVAAFGERCEGGGEVAGSRLLDEGDGGAKMRPVTGKGLTEAIAQASVPPGLVYNFHCLGVAA